MEIHLSSAAKAQDFYKQGKQFLEAAWRCFGQKNTDGRFTIFSGNEFQQLPSPCVVNATFACEMFLKSLLLELDIPYDRSKGGHNLYRLFCKLPADKQEVIARFCSKDLSKFQALLQQHHNDFVNTRYYIENAGWSEMSPMTMVTLGENLSSIVNYLLCADESEGMV